MAEGLAQGMQLMWAERDSQKPGAIMEITLGWVGLGRSDLTESDRDTERTIADPKITLTLALTC